ncbi:MAG: zinc ABC transporter substrate-binding protein [Acidobacteria bacterium]|nr:zinc ABC transporter substrate-binding protein [Acidobacteriota bacterium]
MKRFWIASSVPILLIAASHTALALTVVTTTEDLAALVREVGGDKVSVEAIARGYQDPHFVEAKPSFILKLHNADLLVVVGRDLEAAWLPPLITQSRNRRIQPGAEGYLDASLNAQILEIPTGQITRAMGDVHPLGNPHYWLDPANGRRVAQSLQQKLSQIDGASAGYYARRYADFDRRLSDAEKQWSALVTPYQGIKVVTYHRSWPNFAARFGLDVVGYVEPRPGIPPTPGHILTLQLEMKRLGVKIILVEPYFDTRTPKAVARAVDGIVVQLAPSVGGETEIRTYFDLFDYNLQRLIEAIKAASAKAPGSAIRLRQGSGEPAEALAEAGAPRAKAEDGGVTWTP